MATHHCIGNPCTICHPTLAKVERIQLLNGVNLAQMPDGRFAYQRMNQYGQVVTDDPDNCEDFTHAESMMLRWAEAAKRLQERDRKG